MDSCPPEEAGFAPRGAMRRGPEGQRDQCNGHGAHEGPRYFGACGRDRGREAVVAPRNDGGARRGGTHVMAAVMEAVKAEAYCYGGMPAPRALRASSKDAVAQPVDCQS